MRCVISQFAVCIFTVLALSFSSSAQARIYGTVVYVIDGRTVVLETNAGKTTVQLQFIDVPEPEQALHKTVQDHLRQLVVGRSAEFQPITLSPGKFAGRLSIDDTDISVQMLRDGAAWLVGYQQSGQSKPEYDAYQAVEALAKKEKLGIWSIAGLKPAWELRAEKQEQRQQLVAQRARLDITSEFQTINRPGRTNNNDPLASFDKNTWLDVFAGTATESPGLKTNSDPNGRFQSVYTSHAFVNLVSGQTKQRLECRAFYLDYLLVDGSHRTVYILGFRAISDGSSFSGRPNRLTIIADRRSISIPLLHRERVSAPVGAHEMLFYHLTAANLRDIGSALNVQVRIDKLSSPMDKDLQGLVAQLVSATQ